MLKGQKQVINYVTLVLAYLPLRYGGSLFFYCFFFYTCAATQCVLARPRRVYTELGRTMSEAPPAEITLVSNGGEEFLVAREVALMSGTIAMMLAGDFAESRGRVTFAEISSTIMAKVVDYLKYKHRWNGSQVPIPEFAVEPEIALELLMAAEFLDC